MTELATMADKYAAEKTNEMMTKVIAQAYADGYRDGYKTREDEIPVDLRDNKTEYVDLGLPSGTLWAKEYEKTENDFLYLPFIQAKDYNLPTRSQWEELVKYCRWGRYGNVFRCTGRNGETLDFPQTGKICTNFEYRGNSYLWLLEDSLDEENNAYAYIHDAVPQQIGSCFMGFKLPIRLVKVK